MAESPQNQAKKTYRAESSAVFGVVFEIGFIVALPIVIFGFVGKWFDAKRGGGHAFMYAGIAVALACTVLWFYRRFKDMIARLTKAARLKNTNNIQTQKDPHQWP